MSSPSRSLPNLALSRSELDRAGLWRTDPDLLARSLDDSATRVLTLRDGRAPTRGVESAGGEQGAVRVGAASTQHGEVALELRSPRPEDATRLLMFLGVDSAGLAYVATVEQSDAAQDSDVQSRRHRPGWSTLREVGVALGDRDAGLFTSALALANWHATHSHCPRCGSPTDVVSAGWVRRCPRDGSEHYPRTDPAVIMAITDKDDRLLLARNPTWPAGRRSILAGFVEPGESLEAAVARETAEEVGLELADIEYRGDQPWPFPASLMLGFAARAVDTAMVLDPLEIAEAQFVTREEVGDDVGAGRFGVAGRLSIARRLIEEWYGGPLDAPVELTDTRR